MKFYTLLLICIGALCCAADESQKSGGFFDSLASWASHLPWNKQEPQKSPEEIKKIADETKKIAANAIVSCKAESGVSDEAIAAFRNGDFLKQNVDDKAKKFIKCYLDGLSVTMFGRIQYFVTMERFGAVFGEKKAKEALDKCFRDPAAIKGYFDEDKVLAFYTCFYKNNLVTLL